MKNKKIIILIIILIIALLILSFCMTQLKNRVEKNDNKDDIKVSTEDKKILITESYSNYAWGIQYKGTAIFDDGTIYTWNFSGDKDEFGDYNINSSDGITEYVIENGKSKTKKVSENDLQKLKDYINNLEDNIDISYVGADQGSTSISVWNANEEITLKTSGDAIGENETRNAQEILDIVKKYL